MNMPLGGGQIEDFEVEWPRPFGCILDFQSFSESPSCFLTRAPCRFLTHAGRFSDSVFIVF